MSTLSIQSNTAGLMKALSVTFSDKNKVISEIIQNSRRAGATSIMIHIQKDADSDAVTQVTITDNGTGIDNLQSLFTIGGSNWDVKTNLSEHPYGIGSIAMLYACKTLQIESRDAFVKVDTQDVMEGHAFSQMPLSQPVSGTIITLTDTPFSYQNLMLHVEFLGQYSTAHITVNGQPITQRYTLDALADNPDYTLLSTPIGTLAFAGQYSGRYRVVLQDLVVYEPRYGTRTFFLADGSFQARMPDRDQLVDEAEGIARIDRVIRTAYADYLTKCKAAVIGITAQLHKWVDANFESILAFHPALLNDINFLPGLAFSHVDYPCQRESRYSTVPDPVFRNHVSNDVFIARPSAITIVKIALSAREAIFLDVILDPLHWIFEQGSTFDESAVQILLDNPRPTHATISGIHCDAKVGVADGIIVKYRSWEQTITSGSYLCDEDEFPAADALQAQLDAMTEQYGSVIFLSHDPASIESVLLQGGAYLDGGEGYDELRLQNTIDQVAQIVAVAFGMSPCDFIIKIMPTLPQAIIEKLKDQPVTLHVDENGYLTAKAA